MRASMADFLHSSLSSSSQTPSHTALISYFNQHPHDSRTIISSLSTYHAKKEQEQEEYDEDSDVNDNSKECDNQRGLTFLTIVLTSVKKSFLKTASCGGESMEVGWPTNVRHVAHVTFDRFHGFLGLPVEFQPHVPRKAPSASTTVFGVSTESMQVSYDSRGNSVPTILLLLQHHLYRQGGLQAEGIFRISADNSQEEHLRTQLNRGLVPDGIDVHCFASLIKAWFRELPTGVLDHLSRNQLMQCRSEEECLGLVRLLPPMETALLDWLINLMADVVQHEQFNKMVTHNIAMVFAPNMTQMTDPLTALMYVGQVMKFLKTLILKTLRERGGSVTNPSSVPRVDML
ncbi:Rho GTPase-activating protein 5-like protein [Tanacetum coccineum]|uniref:Rho GTPase-activating protein 5-like protein n=1 Tax=Tanacetum coccineum TaxID=301880 RepID=A0ABQ4Z467_9ASTR